jgi:surface protein
MIIPNEKRIKQIKNNLKENLERINEFKEEIKILNEMNNNCIINLNNDLDGYINMINRIINNLDMLKNYETINNVINFKLEILNKDIKNFLNENLKNKKIYLMNILDRYINQMDIIYEREKEENEIKLFNSKYVENISKKGFLMIDNRINKITEKYKIKDKKIKSIKVKIVIDKIVNHMSYMFSECKSLSSLPDIEKWTTNNVTNMSHMFYKCSSLKELNLNNFNFVDVRSMNSMYV